MSDIDKLANLMAGCQRCHNRYDAPMRRAGIKKRAFAAIPVNDLFATTAQGDER